MPPLSIQGCSQKTMLTEANYLTNYECGLIARNIISMLYNSFEALECMTINVKHPPNSSMVVVSRGTLPKKIEFLKFEFCSKKKQAVITKCQVELYMQYID